MRYLEFAGNRLNLPSLADIDPANPLILKDQPELLISHFDVCSPSLDLGTAGFANDQRLTTNDVFHNFTQWLTILNFVHADTQEKVHRNSLIPEYLLTTVFACNANRDVPICKYLILLTDAFEKCKKLGRECSNRQVNKIGQPFRLTD